MLGWQRTYSASDLKRIAMGTMVLDHLAFHLMERGGTDLPMAWYILGTAMRLAGRVAFPLYGFFLVQGFFHTGDWGRYMTVSYTHLDVYKRQRQGRTCRSLPGPVQSR